MIFEHCRSQRDQGRRGRGPGRGARVQPFPPGAGSRLCAPPPPPETAARWFCIVVVFLCIVVVGFHPSKPVADPTPHRSMFDISTCGFFFFSLPQIVISAFVDYQHSRRRWRSTRPSRPSTLKACGRQCGSQWWVSPLVIHF